LKRLRKHNINTKRYWDKVYSAPTSQDVKDRRYLMLAHYVREKDRVLDVGCGGGWQCFVVSVARPQAEIYGVDISPMAIAKAERAYSRIANFKVGLATSTGFPDSFFDTVVSGEVIEHLEKPELFIKEAARILKKGGKLLITTPYLEENNRFSQEHLWSFDGFDIQEMCKKYFSGVYFIPWASGRRITRARDGSIVKEAGEEDILLVLAKK